MDSDDLRKGWLVNRVLGERRGDSLDEEAPIRHTDDGQGTENVSRSNRWGARGISVAADDTLHDHQHQSKNKSRHTDGTEDERQGMLDDDDDDGLFSDDEDARAIDATSPSKTDLNSGDAWQTPNQNH